MIEEASSPKAAPSSAGRELRQLARVAVPTGLANLVEYLPVSFALWFVGRRSGGLDLDALALGRAYFNVTCFSVAYGLISALRTLCPQAVGGGRGKQLHGLYAQRALFVVCVGAVVGVAAVLAGEPILVHVLRQPPALARRAQRYCVGLLASLAGIALMTIIQRVMTAEGHTVANFVICLIVCASAPAWQWFLIDEVTDSYMGAAWASSAYNCSYLLLQVPYCVYAGLGHVFAPRPLREVLSRDGIREYLGLALPGLVFTLLEWWSVELVLALGGTRASSTTVLGALATCFNIQTCLEMMWLGLMVGVSVRVGEKVGAGDARSAKRAAFLGVALAGALGALCAGVILLLRPVIARLFARDEAIVRLTHRCVPALAALVFCDALNVCVQGALSGAGLPKHIARANLLGWYGVGAPVALGLVLGLGLDKAAAPVLLGSCASALAFSFLVQLRAVAVHDWTASVAAARRRLSEAAPLDELLLPDGPPDAVGEGPIV